MNKDGVTLNLKQISCDEIVLQQARTASNAKPDLWNFKLDGSDNSLPASLIAHIEAGEQQAARNFHYKLFKVPSTNDIHIVAKHQSMTILNPANGMEMAKFVFDYEGRIEIWNGTILLSTEKLELVDLPTLGSAMAKGESAADMPAWKRGFLAGANYVLTSVFGNFSERLTLK